MKTDQLGKLPLREELDALAHIYQHLRVEHQGAGRESGVRRRIEDRLLRVRERFEHLLQEFVADEELRQAWLEHLDGHVPEPAQPEAIWPLVFRGRAEDTGSIAEIRLHGDELDVWIDGALEERLDPRETFESGRYRFGKVEFVELFDVSDGALEALDAYRRDGGEPPWEVAGELLGEGLIDPHFALTPRGRRAQRV